MDTKGHESIGCERDTRWATAEGGILRNEAILKPRMDSNERQGAGEGGIIDDGRWPIADGSGPRMTRMKRLRIEAMGGRLEISDGKFQRADGRKPEVAAMILRNEAIWRWRRPADHADDADVETAKRSHGRKIGNLRSQILGGQEGENHEWTPMDTNQSDASGKRDGRQQMVG